MKSEKFLKIAKILGIHPSYNSILLFCGENVFEIVIFHHVTLEYWKWVIKSQNSKNRVVQPLLNQNIEMPRLIICQRNQQKYIIGFPLLIWFHLYNLNWRILSSRIDTRHAYTSYIMALSDGEPFATGHSLWRSDLRQAIRSRRWNWKFRVKAFLKTETRSSVTFKL